MSSIYFTITGTNQRYGLKIFRPEMSVRLVKEPENRRDGEAIRVELEGLGCVGYVANSPGTVAGRGFSAGRLYDRISGTAEGTVLYVLPRGVFCRLSEASLCRTGILEKKLQDRDSQDEAERILAGIGLTVLAGWSLLNGETPSVEQGIG